MNDPDEVIIDFSESRVADMSGIEALNKITERYADETKHFAQLATYDPEIHMELKSNIKSIMVSINEKKESV